MPDYTILVTFDLVPGAMPDFLALVTENASQSLDLEDGCRVFDVLLPGGVSDRVVLYERYVDKAGFEAHCRSAHFLSFDAASRSMVKAKDFVEFTPVGMSQMA